MVQTILNIVYHLLALGLILVLGWNTISLEDRKKQVMSAIVMIPLLLRVLNIK